jgi:hypothetical protein
MFAPLSVVNVGYDFASEASTNIYPLKTVTSRWICIAFILFGLASLTLGSIALSDGDTGYGIIKLVLGAGWLLVAAYQLRGRQTVISK